MMSVDAQIARSFFANQPEPGHRGSSQGYSRPIGTIATLLQMVDGLERNRLMVLVTSRLNECVCLRSPVGLAAGATYKLQIGTHRDQSTFLKITSSRLREDGSYDVGARELSQTVRYATAA